MWSFAHIIKHDQISLFCLTSQFIFKKKTVAVLSTVSEYFNFKLIIYSYLITNQLM